MKPIRELVRETERESNSAIARRALIQKQLQQSCAILLARWLRSLGEDVPEFQWSYER
jgi:hypothetical protein